MTVKYLKQCINANKRSIKCEPRCASISLNGVIETVVCVGYHLLQYQKATKDQDYDAQSIYLFHR
jgi:hypothetical protein